MEFYVPYNQVKFFTQHDCGVSRHTLALRLYLYLCHQHSGRIKWDDRKLLVQTFNSSHTAVKKALEYLDLINFVKIDKGWVQANGHDKVDEILNGGVGRLFNIEFNFNLDILLNARKFTNHLFTCIFQASAMIRGKKKKVSIPQENHTDGMLGNRQNENSGFEFIQKQSLTYLAKMTERNPQTIFKRNKSINAENHYSRNLNPVRVRIPANTQQRQGLTEAGFFPKEKSPLIASRNKSEIVDRLKILKEKDPKFKSCFVIRGKHGAYIITKDPPTEYIFSVKTKTPYKNFKEDFSVSQTPK